MRDLFRGASRIFLRLAVFIVPTVTLIEIAHVLPDGLPSVIVGALAVCVALTGIVHSRWQLRNALYVASNEVAQADRPLH